jgi:fimbrial chaperone protein
VNTPTFSFRSNVWAKALCGAALALLFAAASAPLSAAPFEIGATPTRFILTGKSSGRIGQTLTVFNLGTAPTELALRTLDWTFTESGNVTYHDELLPNSCRTWVTLERKTLKIGARDKRAFRFQIEVPADAPRGECRFMVALEGVEPATKALLESGGSNLSLPVSGRIAVAVYIAINGAEPKLEMKQVTTEDIQGKRTPVITVSNSGDAHARLDGGLNAVDAQKNEFELLPDSSPILPGQTRSIRLLPKAEDGKAAANMVFPVVSKGSIDWEKGSFKVAAEFK